MNLFINGIYPDSLCKFCAAGSVHSLRVHAKVLAAMQDEAVAEAIEAAAPIVMPPASQNGPQGGRKAALVPTPKLNPKGPSGAAVAPPVATPVQAWKVAAPSQVW